MTLTDLPAPAKLNLFLHITGRREDGYHLLQSVFMLIDWADTLHFERRQDGQIRRIDAPTHAGPGQAPLRLPARETQPLFEGRPLTLLLGPERIESGW